MQERFDIELQDSWVVELDSSKASKFSRHVIIQIPGAAFQSNFHVGAFVKGLCETPAAAGSPAADREPREQLLINKVRPAAHHLASECCAFSWARRG